jgi:putative endonuclease
LHSNPVHGRGGTPARRFPGGRGDVDGEAALRLQSGKRPNGTLHVGVTSDLLRRVGEHKADLIDGFTAKYQVHLLVHFEMHADMREAITREKQIKEWRRLWKLELIERTNPQWRDLYSGFIA